MLLTVTTTTPPATDLGYLLHKHPERVQSFEVPAGTAHVLYPEATEERTTAALLLEVDPVALVRGSGRGGGRGQRGAGPLAEYVDDRPYAASSLLAVALGRVFRSAVAGRCAPRPELVDRRLDLELHLPAVPVRGGPEEARAFLEPLGWAVTATPSALDPEIPAWGDSPYVDLRLTGTHRLADALAHVYVLLPAMGGTKHYWVGQDEAEKLLRVAGPWLSGHPLRERITHRYLAGQRRLTDDVLARLAEVDDALPDAADDDAPPTAAPGPAPDEDAPVPGLARQRLDAVLGVLREVGARTVVDLGCGEGALVAALLDEPGVERVLGVDVSPRVLARAERRLGLDRMSEHRRRRVELAQSSLTYVDPRIAGFDAAVLMEVVEHVDPPRLAALERNVLGRARPGAVVVTTPNAEHNIRFPGLARGGLRHHDHRFEWDRAAFRAWAETAAGRYGYDVELRGVGVDDPEVGPPTQLAVLRRREKEVTA